MNMAIYDIAMTKLEVNGNMVALKPGHLYLFSENNVIMKYEVEQSLIGWQISSVWPFWFVVHVWLVI